MLLNDIKPFVRYAAIGGVGNSYYSSKEIFIWLQTSDCRLFYILDGSGEIIVDEKEYKLIPGSAILFQSGTKYRWNTKKVGIISINFDYTENHSSITSPIYPVKIKYFKKQHILENIYFENAPVLNNVLYIPDASYIEYFLRLISSSFWIEDMYVNELLSSYMKATIISIVHNVHDSMDNNNNHNTAVVNKIIQYIQNNYTKNLTNEDIGKTMNFNSAYVNRIFKEHTGTTIHNFLINYRLTTAQELLRSQKGSVNDICFNVGFNDISHFTKSFKHLTGKTPTEYRKANLDDCY